MSGKLISIEGVEGVGKSSIKAALIKTIKYFGLPVVSTREPGGTKIAEAIRSLVLSTHFNERMHDKTELLLMFAARCQHIEEVIKPALADGAWVVTDRYIDSSHAYNGRAKNRDDSAIDWLQSFIVGEVMPDLTLFLDCPVEIGMQRAKLRGELNRIEQSSLDYFNAARQIFLERADAYPDRIRVIDANRSFNEVEADAVELIKQCMNSTPTLSL